MAFKLLPRTRENTATVGTGAIALGGAVSPNNLTFGAQMSEGDTTFACALSSDGSTWEEGLYTLTSGALARTAIIANSAGDTSPVALDGGRVFGIIPGDVLLLLSKLLAPVDGQVIKYDGALGRFAAASVGGVSWHQAVALATDAALPANTYSNGSSGVGATLTGNSNGALTVDSVAAVVGYRILVKDEATAAHNGIYVVTAAGDGSHPYVLTRGTDHDDPGDIAQADATVVGTAGAVNGSTIWVSTIAFPFTLGSSSMLWSMVVGLPPITSDGDVLTIDGGVPAWLPSSGGGSVALDDLTDVTIASPSTGDVLAFNGTSGEFENSPAPVGSAGGLYQYLMSELPTQDNSGFSTWVNQGGATVNEGAAGLSIRAPAGSDNLRVLKRASLTAPFSKRFLIGLTAITNNYQQIGIGFTDGTKFQFACLTVDNSVTGNWAIGTTRWSNITTSVDASLSPTRANPLWVRLRNTGTHVFFEWSITGDDDEFLTLLDVDLSGSPYLSAYTDIVMVVNRSSAGGSTDAIGTLFSAPDDIPRSPNLHYGLYSGGIPNVPTIENTGLSTWVAQGSATAANKSTGIVIKSPGVSGDQNRLLIKAAPTPPYRIKALLTASLKSFATTYFGLTFYDGTNKMQGIFCVIGSALTIAGYSFDNPTTFNTTNGSAATPNGALSLPLSLYLDDDGTNVSFGYSANADISDFQEIYNVPKSTGFLGSSGYVNIGFAFNIHADGLNNGTFTILGYEEQT